MPRLTVRRRWIRLLFGREFPFESVLSLWDALFAEDPGLDLVDFICVAMLLRIRWQLLQADYSSALALLLRYPVPTTGPVTLVEDAITIRGDLSVENGARLISKYSGKTPRSMATPRSPTRAPRRGSEDLGSLRFPGQIFQDSRIEEMISGAAKGMYRHTERLGLNQALRDAVQGLQSGNGSPRPTARWSLDKGRIVEDDEKLRSRIESLQTRSKGLGKLLQAAMEDLSGYIKQAESEAKVDPYALSLVLAKLQYIQIYLEDSSLPFGNGAPESRGDSGETALTATSNLPMRETHQASKATPSPTRRPRQARTESPLRASFKQSRPSLAESSYSWMLGDSPANSHFGSSSPFSPEQERKAATQGSDQKASARGKVGFLFGDQSTAKAVEGSGPAREDSEGFTMGTLRGPQS